MCIDQHAIVREALYFADDRRFVKQIAFVTS